ncbi:hypothetical protein MHBO_000788 [Bonamia ostreae]|uniref:Ycf1 n=1 Tax=Bonamia ostreae TaxID=126728 RepID=A0ABV2AHN9_9EUKA
MPNQKNYFVNLKLLKIKTEKSNHFLGNLKIDSNDYYSELLLLEIKKLQKDFKKMKLECKLWQNNFFYRKEPILPNMQRNNPKWRNIQRRKSLFDLELNKAVVERDNKLSKVHNVEENEFMETLIQKKFKKKNSDLVKANLELFLRF